MIENQNTYTQFISQNSNPDSFFDLLLYSADRFSWIVDDYVALENSLQGIVASNGLEFGVGPNISLSGVGMLFAVGHNFKCFIKKYFQR